MSDGPSGPAITAIIVTWNSADVVEGCLTTLRQELGPEACDIMVIDNASADTTVERVRAIDPTVRVIANPANVGLSAANNQGLASAVGDYWFICNPDVQLQPGAVTAMVEVMQRHERCGWVVPRVLHEDGALQTSAGDLPTLAQTLLGRQAARRRAPGSPTGFWWDGWPHTTEQEIGRGFECAYLVRRQAVAEVGPQDERYKLDWEGFDWTERFRRAHWQIWLAPLAEVVHLGGTSRRQVPFRSIVSQHKGMYLYFSSRSSPVARPFLALAFGARALCKVALTSVGVPLYSWGHRDRRQAAADA